MSSEEDFNGGFVPHRIPVTVIASLIAFFIIGCNIALLLQQHTFIGKRKAVQYMVLSSFGLLFYLQDTLHIVWDYEEYNSDVSTTVIYYAIAVPFHFLPVIIRSWRIFCVYRSTPTWNCTMEPITSRRRRGHKWMLLRIAIIYIPWAICSIGIIWDPDIPYYVYIGMNGTYAIANFLLTVLLYHMRAELRPKYLDETSSLLVYSILSLIEWAFANTIYILALLVDMTWIMIYYCYIDLFLIGMIWFFTTGKTLYRVYKRRDVIGDKRPELGKRDIQKALQRMESQRSGGSAEMTTTSEMEI
jgi:hypothetical protein